MEKFEKLKNLGRGAQVRTHPPLSPTAAVIRAHADDTDDAAGGVWARYGPRAP